MARALNRLSAARVRAVGPGRHADGGGLYLYVSPQGARSWVFMFTRDRKRREMGLGAYPAVTLAKARALAAAARAAVAEGRDPLAEKRREAEPDFAGAAAQFLESMESSWRNEKHRAQWRMTLGDAYCAPILDKRVSTISTDDILRVLKPHWQTKPETASRVRGRIERVLDFATVRGWRAGDNPARWRGHLKSILPERQKLSRGHHAAMPFEAVPAFMARLRAREAMAAKALAFIILTAARSGEALGATWGEINFAERVWTVPDLRMKARRAHRVPLSDDALEILTPLYEARTGAHVFPGQRRGKPLSAAAIDNLMGRMGEHDATIHGFRSAFRDWAGDETAFPRDVAEAALAHVIADATERAYRRSDALEKRRQLMAAWARWCRGDAGAKVVALNA